MGELKNKVYVYKIILLFVNMFMCMFTFILMSSFGYMFLAHVFCYIKPIIIFNVIFNIEIEIQNITNIHNLNSIIMLIVITSSIVGARWERNFRPNMLELV